MNGIFSAIKSGQDKPVVADESGFSLLEFLVSASILVVLGTVIFSTLNDIQCAAGRQAGTQAVLDNIRIALQVVERCIRQAGNDPHDTGFEAVSIISETEMRIHTDITGSEGPGKGDPDGDINDSGEDLAIRYNIERKRIEMISRNGPAQIIADNITAFSLRFFDTAGNETFEGRDVQK